MMLPVLNEKQKRLYLASEAMEIGRGGIAQVSRASGTARSVIVAGIKELRNGDVNVISIDAPIRRKGAGRKPITESQPGIEEALEKLVGPSESCRGTSCGRIQNCLSQGGVSFAKNGIQSPDEPKDESGWQRTPR